MPPIREALFVITELKISLMCGMLLERIEIMGDKEVKIELSKITPRQKLIIAKGLCDYQYIMENWQTNDADFKKVYYDFYLRARWAVMSNPKNSDPYFEKLQSIRPDEDLMTIIKELKDEIEEKSFEFSLVSKLLHTRNSSLPIYDSKVRDYLSKEEGVHFLWNGSSHNDESGEKKIQHDWKALRDWYCNFLKSPEGEDWINWFNTNFPTYTNISDVKKVDFIIFATQ